MTLPQQGSITPPGLVPPPIRFASLAPLEDMFDLGMDGREGEEIVLDADGVVIVDEDEGEGGGEGDKAVVGEGGAWGGR